MRAIVFHAKNPDFGLSELRKALGPIEWVVAATANFEDHDDQLKVGVQASSVPAVDSFNSRYIVKVADHLFRHTN